MSIQRDRVELWIGRFGGSVARTRPRGSRIGGCGPHRLVDPAMRTAGFFLIGAAFSFLAGWAFCGAIEGRGFEFWAAAVGAVPGGVSAFWIGLSRTGVLR